MIPIQPSKPLKRMVPRGGVEPPTHGFSEVAWAFYFKGLRHTFWQRLADYRASSCRMTSAQVSITPINLPSVRPIRQREDGARSRKGPAVARREVTCAVATATSPPSPRCSTISNAPIKRLALIDKNASLQRRYRGVCRTLLLKRVI